MNQRTAEYEAEILALRDDAFVRVLGVDRAAAQVLADALRHGAPLQRRGSAPTGQETPDDYALIDPLLHVDVPVDPARVPAPPRGAGYAGMTPAQRGVLLAWLADPLTDAPDVYREFYLAHLEVQLLESTPARTQALTRLRELQAVPGWQRHHDLYRAILLGHWLSGASDQLVAWLSSTRLPAEVLETGLACQAQFDAPLTPDEFGQMLAAWGLRSVDLSADMLKTRLASLEATLGMPPLAYVQSQWQEADLVPRPWRCAHRDLRIALPQPPVRTLLEPHLRDLDRIAPVRVPPPAAPAATPRDAPAGHADNVIILEFGQSRSEFFDYALELAQREDGFSQLLDEHRRIVYRVTFEKRRLRNFWRLWDYVQNWQHTRVYADREELEKWKVWPYSQYMR